MKKQIIIVIIAFILGMLGGIITGTVLVEKQDVQKEVQMENATATDVTEMDATMTDATETDVATEENTIEEITEEIIEEPEPEVEGRERDDLLVSPAPITEAEITTEYVAPEPVAPPTDSNPGGHLTKASGIFYGPSGKETYYNLDMSGVISNARNMGIEGEYWVREDGCKMYGSYIICAADLNIHPRGSLVESSLGTCIVLDTGGFATNGSGVALDIAVTW